MAFRYRRHFDTSFLADDGFFASPEKGRTWDYKAAWHGIVKSFCNEIVPWVLKRYTRFLRDYTIIKEYTINKNFARKLRVYKQFTED